MNVLAIGAHPDDIELGCKGALAAHRERGDRVHVLVMTDGVRGRMHPEVRAGEEMIVRLLAELPDDVHSPDGVWPAVEWPDGSCPDVACPDSCQDGAVPSGGAAVEAIQAAVIRLGIDLVYTHTPRDSDPDHRATAAATLTACQLVCAVRLYETATTLDFQHRLCRRAARRGHSWR
jgi:LmbE family N-acetylglucosaminyl deacetylase